MASSHQILTPVTEPACFLDFEPYQMLHAFWRRTEALPYPEPLPFDIDRVKKQVALVRVAGNQHARPEQIFKCDPLLWSREESLFILQAIASKQLTKRELDNEEQVHELLNIQLDKQIASRDFTSDPGAEALCDLVVEAFRPRIGKGIQPPQLVTLALINLLPLARFIALWSEHYSEKIGSEVLSAVRQYKLPYISDGELAQAEVFVREQVSLRPWHPTHPKDDIPVPLVMAAVLALQDLVLPVVEKIDDSFYIKAETTQLARPQILVLGLREPALVKHHLLRLSLTLDNQSDYYGWLAQTGWSELTIFLERAVQANRIRSLLYSNIAQIMSTLSKVHAPATAPIMLVLSQKEVFAQFAKEWLKSNPLLTFVGLAEADFHDLFLQTKADKILLDLCSKVRLEKLPVSMHAIYDALKAEKRAKRKVDSNKKKPVELGDSDAPDYISDLFAQYPCKIVKLPAYLTGPSAPVLQIDGHKLSERKNYQLLVALKSSKPVQIHPLILALRAKFDRATFDEFVTWIFKLWLTHDAPAVDKWCFLSVGYLGSNANVCSIIPLMKQWRTHNPGRAKMGLECLRASGTDMALMKIHEISQAGSLRSLRTSAKKLIVEIAHERNLTPGQLEDRIVPNCGLDSSGHHVFDFGPRQFYIVLGNDLKPCLKDSQGNVRSDLPSPNQSDDPILASQAIKAWKAIRGEVKVAISNQSKRLEAAMISRRRWTQEEFDTLLVGHPVLNPMCKLLIWGQFDSSDRLLCTFRLTEEGDYADSSDKSIELYPAASIGLIHPLHLAPTELAAWGELASDYALVAPFAQLGRQVYLLTAEELQAERINRFDGLKVEAIVIPGTLERAGWINEVLQDGAVYFGHYKYFAGSDLTASIVYTGITVPIDKSEPQEIVAVIFYKGKIQVNRFYDSSGLAQMALSQVDRVVVSEVLSDLTLVMNKSVKA